MRPGFAGIMPRLIFMILELAPNANSPHNASCIRWHAEFAKLGSSGVQTAAESSELELKLSQQGLVTRLCIRYCWVHKEDEADSVALKRHRVV